MTGSSCPSHPHVIRNPLSICGVGQKPTGAASVLRSFVCRRIEPTGRVRDRRTAVNNDHEPPEPALPRERPLGSSAPVPISRIHVGMEVYGSDGERIGTDKATRTADFYIDRPRAFDLYVPLHWVRAVDGNRIVLDVVSERVDGIGWTKAMELTGYASAKPKASQDS
jgi:hypothetical protein